jgi:preprotein translocase subunit YajC
MQQLALPIIMFGAFYLLLLRPQKKKLAAQRKLLDNVAEGAEIMTTSGIYGFVTAVDGDVVWLEIASGVDIRITKAAISKIIETPTSGAVDAPSVGTDTSTPATNDPTSNDSGGSSGDN